LQWLKVWILGHDEPKKQSGLLLWTGLQHSYCDDEAAKVKRNDGKKACVRWMENVKMTDILG
jgi:hypothetical protein